MRLHILAVPAALLLSIPFAHAADPPTAQVGAVGDLASLLEGQFTTSPAPAEAGARPQAQKPVLYELAKRVKVPTLEGESVYAELREGAPDGRLLRQRLYALKMDEDKGGIAMTEYSFGNGPELAGAQANAAPLANLNPSALKPLHPGCAVIWRKTDNGFDGNLPSGACGGPSGAPNPETAAVSVSKTGLAEWLDGDKVRTVFRRLR